MLEQRTETNIGERVCKTETLYRILVSKWQVQWVWLPEKMWGKRVWRIWQWIQRLLGQALSRYCLNLYVVTYAVLVCHTHTHTHTRTHTHMHTHTFWILTATTTTTTTTTSATTITTSTTSTSTTANDGTCE